MTWGDKHEKGCKSETEPCQFSHPPVCPKSLDLECLDWRCEKLHTRKCKRPRKRVERDNPRTRPGPAAGGRPPTDRRRSTTRPDQPPRHDRGPWRGPRPGGDIPVWTAGNPGQNPDLGMMGLRQLLEAQQQGMMKMFREQMLLQQQETQRLRGDVMRMVGGQGGAVMGGGMGMVGGGINRPLF